MGAAVNNVIRFRPANGQFRVAPDGRGAKILFFTGVRYQRIGEETRAPAPQPPRARRKRQGDEIGGARDGRTSRR